MNLPPFTAPWSGRHLGKRLAGLPSAPMPPNGRSLVALLECLDDNNGERYYRIMIASFADRDTERLFNRERVRRYPSTLHGVMRRKLLLLDAALALEELRVPPRNRLEKLRGDRAGQHSIRVNQQWRVCFRWRDGAAFAVEIVDYH